MDFEVFETGECCLCGEYQPLDEWGMCDVCAESMDDKEYQVAVANGYEG